MASLTLSKPTSSNHSVLSDKKILEYKTQGKIVIEPFIPQHLSTSSYDVTLGRYYFRETPDPRRFAPTEGFNKPPVSYFNPYSKKDVETVWGTVQTAKPASSFPCPSTEGIAPMDEVIMIAPGETILAHTIEFVGGKEDVTTMMKARSSMGRSFIEVCKCAGWGDVGYFNRWTMEITNNSQWYTIPLVVGRRIAQIVFFATDQTLAISNQSNPKESKDTEAHSKESAAPPTQTRSYVHQGKYQVSMDLAEIQKNWTPQSCLPRMHLDHEVTDGSAKDTLFIQKG